MTRIIPERVQCIKPGLTYSTWFAIKAPARPAAEPAITNLAYQETTGQLSLTPGDYWITVTAAGDKSTVAFDSGGTLALEGKVNYTVIARDPADGEDIGGNIVTVILLTD